DLARKAYVSIRKFHPNMPIIIIDGSDPQNPCSFYVKTLVSDKTKVISLGFNIGHGKGMHMGISQVKTKYALIFDSDIEMLKTPISQMLEMMEEGTFGVGTIVKTGFDGINYGLRSHHEKTGPILYLHPQFQLININKYKKFPPYIHHGAPCLSTMLDMHKRGLSDKILINFPSLETFVKHRGRGTREVINLRGKEMMATIAFITRVHPRRPEMLKICIESIKAQTSENYVHILHRDDKTEKGYGRFLANKSFAKISPINARYVMAIDDDDMIIDSDFVKVFKKVVDKNDPEIVFFKGHISSAIYPAPTYWAKPPVRAQIGGSCFAVRLDVWKKHIHEFGKECCGDFHFINACYRDTRKRIWLDRIVSKTQKKAGFGKGEDTHA
ncbi:unnamed protein product, partial [marine sediment metagenome]